MSIGIVVFMYAIWSSIFSLGKMALAYSPPLFLTGFRMGLGALILLAFLTLRNRTAFRLSLRQYGSLAILGFFSVYLTNALEFWALQHLSSAKTCFIYSLGPFFAAFFSYLHFNEKMTPAKWLGLALGFAGFLPVLWLQTGSEELLSIYSFLTWPTLAMMGAALCGIYGWILLRLAVKGDTISPLMANGASMFFGSLLAFGHSLFNESWTPLPVATENIPPFLFWALIITAVSNIVCYNLYGHLLKKYTATFLSFVGLLSPIFASFYGWLFLGEPISWVIFLSTGIVSIGLWIVYRTELRQGYIAKQNQLIS